MASGFICSNWPLLPVSIVDTPSIMMLFCPPPPSRVVVPTTPGVRAVNAAKLRAEIGRFSTSAVVTLNERSPLCDWISGASDLTVTVSDVPPTESVSAPTLMRSPPLTATPGRTTDENPGIAISTV